MRKIRSESAPRSTKVFKTPITPNFATCQMKGIFADIFRAMNSPNGTESRKNGMARIDKTS